MSRLLRVPEELKVNSNSTERTDLESGSAEHSRRAASAREPITLYRVMKQVTGKQLQTFYEPPQDMPHALLVLVMQMNDENDEKTKGV